MVFVPLVAVRTFAARVVSILFKTAWIWPFELNLINSFPRASVLFPKVVWAICKSATVAFGSPIRFLVASNCDCVATINFISSNCCSSSSALNWRAAKSFNTSASEIILSRFPRTLSCFSSVPVVAFLFPEATPDSDKTILFEVDSLTDSEMDSLTDSETDTDSDTDSLTDSETDSLTDWDTDSLVEADIDSLVEVEFDSLAGSELDSDCERLFFSSSIDESVVSLESLTSLVSVVKRVVSLAITVSSAKAFSVTTVAPVTAPSANAPFKIVLAEIFFCSYISTLMLCSEVVPPKKCIKPIWEMRVRTQFFPDLCILTLVFLDVSPMCLTQFSFFMFFISSFYNIFY